MNDVIYMVLISTVFVLIICCLMMTHSLHRKEWDRERNRLLDTWKSEREALYERIHSGSYNEYKHAEIQKIKAEKPKEQTTLEEV